MEGHWWWKFEPDRWLADERLQLCSLSARGMWMQLLCHMKKNPRVGYLSFAGKPYSIEQIAQAARCSVDEAERALKELRDAEVFSTSADGFIFSRKMVRDSLKSSKCSAAGSKGGGNPTFKGQSKGHSKGQPKGSSSSALTITTNSDSLRKGGEGGKPAGPVDDALVRELVAAGVGGEMRAYLARKLAGLPNACTLVRRTYADWGERGECTGLLIQMLEDAAEQARELASRGPVESEAVSRINALQAIGIHPMKVGDM